MRCGNAQEEDRSDACGHRGWEADGDAEGQGYTDGDGGGVQVRWRQIRQALPGIFRKLLALEAEG